MGQIISIGLRGTPYVRACGSSQGVGGRPAASGQLSDGETRFWRGVRDWNTADRKVVLVVGERRRRRNDSHNKAARNAHYRAELALLGLL